MWLQRRIEALKLPFGAYLPYPTGLLLLLFAANDAIDGRTIWFWTTLLFAVLTLVGAVRGHRRGLKRRAEYLASVADEPYDQEHPNNT
jgi:hypothetical protein